MRKRLWPFVAAAMVLAILSASCGASDGEANLSVQWVREGADASSVEPTEPVRSLLVVQNDGGKDLDDVTLRFNQGEAGGLPFGVSVGTITNARSRFEDDTQVWELGAIDAGKSVTFPVTLWFDAGSRLAGSFTVRLVMVASSPGLQSRVESNPLEVVVDAGQAVRP